MQEVRAIKIYRSYIRVKSASVIDVRIDPAGWVLGINPEIPPPVDIIGVIVLVKYMLTVGRHGFVQPGLESLVVSDSAIPPLVGRLVHGNR